jgi:DNA-binding SARP family transcriptional activator
VVGDTVVGDTVRVEAIAAIRLLGRFELRIDGVAVPSMDSVRVESLLAYLLLNRDVDVSRQRLAVLLWPDSTDVQARTNLRHVLHTLRRRLPDVERYLEIGPRFVRWRRDATYWLDVARFDGLLASDADGSDGDDRLTGLREAVALYVGDLLEGCDDEWLLGERERLRLRLLDALVELAVCCEARGALAEAVSYAERVLRADPLREEVYRQLMRLHDTRGDRAQALRAYHVCASTLDRELGVEPSPATEAVYQAVVRREPRPASATPVGGPPLVGRGVERARLVAAWRSTIAGQAHYVLVSGEAGVGKSRLVEELRRWCARRGGVTVDACCYPAEGSLAYAPVVAWLRSAALRPRLARLDRALLTDLARLLPELLVEFPELERPVPRPEADQLHRLFDAVAAVVLGGGDPVLLVVDDIQHADRETCQLVHYLLRVQPEARLLVVATARREAVDIDHPMHGLHAALRARERLAEIELARLGRDETAVLASRVSGVQLAERDAERLYAETEGNPLFVVEALRAGWTADRPLTPRVQSVIDARLSQLNAKARELIGVAATVGREFGTDVLGTAWGASEDELVESLDELWRRGLIRERGGALSDGMYDFSHDKIRQVAYRGLSPARRRLLHGRVASALERTHAADPGPVSVQIAAHLDRAGATEQAVGWYRRAAEAAQLLYATTDAVRLLERGLELLDSQPESAERDAAELEMRTALLAPLVSVDAYESPGVSAVRQRAVQLARTLGVEVAPQLLRSLALGALTRADFAAATGFGSRLHAVAQRRHDDVLAVEAAYVLGIASFWQADFSTARDYFELAVARYRPEGRLEHLVRYGQDPKVVCLSRLGNTLWFLGRPDDAREARSAALLWADEVEHPFSRHAALTFGAVLGMDMGDEHAVREYAAAMGSVSEQQPLAQMNVQAFRGYLAVLDGDAATGIAAIRGAIRGARDAPAVPGHLAMLTRILLGACEAAGDAPAALEAAGRLLDMGGAACVWEPEARRVLAELGRSG